MWCRCRHRSGGREPTNLPQPGGTCGDWTSGGLMTDVAVNDTPTYDERLSKYAKPCDVSERMVCILTPPP